MREYLNEITAILNRIANEEPGNLGLGILCMMLGCAAVWGLLFAIGYVLCGKWGHASVLGVVTVLATIWLMRLVPRIKLS
jgi:hypothetical protein